MTAVVGCRGTLRSAPVGTRFSPSPGLASLRDVRASMTARERSGGVLAGMRGAEPASRVNEDSLLNPDSVYDQIVDSHSYSFCLRNWPTEWLGDPQSAATPPPFTSPCLARPCPPRENRRGVSKVVGVPASCSLSRVRRCSIPSIETTRPILRRTLRSGERSPDGLGDSRSAVRSGTLGRSSCELRSQDYRLPGGRTVCQLPPF